MCVAPLVDFSQPGYQEIVGELSSPAATLNKTISSHKVAPTETMSTMRPRRALRLCHAASSFVAHEEEECEAKHRKRRCSGGPFMSK